MLEMQRQQNAETTKRTKISEKKTQTVKQKEEKGE